MPHAWKTDHSVNAGCEDRIGKTFTLQYPDGLEQASTVDHLRGDHQESETAFNARTGIGR